jgi:hypothetical protein
MNAGMIHATIDQRLVAEVVVLDFIDLDRSCPVRTSWRYKRIPWSQQSHPQTHSDQRSPVLGNAIFRKGDKGDRAG